MANKILNIGIALLFSFTIYAQDYKKVDATVKAYPHSFRTLDKLASRIDKDFTREDEKARAIFTWIATNISYDLNALGTTKKRSGFSYSSESELIAKQKQFQEDMAYITLRSKKGVCQGYATLYAVIAEKVGLETEVVPGTAKSYPAHIGRYPNISDHAWNVVKINGEWKLLDVTWGAGSVIGSTKKFEFDFNDSYFFSSPKEFFLKHYPEDEKWLLLKATKEEFAALPLYYRNYFREGYEVVAPTKGILTTGQGVISFIMKHLKVTDRIGYVLAKDNSFNEIKPVFNNDIAKFQIPLDRNSVGVLTIYVNGESIVSYRIDKG
ncbi:hypothetical protein DVK85_11125 [Flavobacterium arcticum]|uniref:Transglutaminase-like domain-containing protein n=1 Tax=Flavobacterium arcticum TaxID=1784713 RepID=A0A345HDU1_9FLAO|nr:transglutaminase domain-containing protein [Flavobacterium arcticum]AXG74751.1 hypothetical protein DVK85_11125 [Flavobacterium arcticum]KAF2509749.1 hypothetical protein E0W72_09550 [Flavobacterium arcticum]